MQCTQNINQILRFKTTLVAFFKKKAYRIIRPDASACAYPRCKTDRFLDTLSVSTISFTFVAFISCLLSGTSLPYKRTMQSLQTMEEI